MISRLHSFFFFFFNDTATTEIYTLSLHDALPISAGGEIEDVRRHQGLQRARRGLVVRAHQKRLAHVGDVEQAGRSEEHTSELQSRLHLVCRLLLEKKKKKNIQHTEVCGIATVYNS